MLVCIYQSMNICTHVTFFYHVRKVRASRFAFFSSQPTCMFQSTSSLRTWYSEYHSPNSGKSPGKVSIMIKSMMLKSCICMLLAADGC